MKISLSHYYKTTVWLVTLLACWLSAGAQTRTVQLPHGKLVYTITNLGDTFTVKKEESETSQHANGYPIKHSYCEVVSDFVGDKLSAGTEINVDANFYPDNDGEKVCFVLRLDAEKCLTCINPDPQLVNNEPKYHKGTSDERPNTISGYVYRTRKSPYHVNRTFRVNKDITDENKSLLFRFEVEYEEWNGFTYMEDGELQTNTSQTYSLKSDWSEYISVHFVDSPSAPPKTESGGSSNSGLLDTLTQLLGLDQHATPEEAVVISSLAALLALLLGGAGAVGGGAGGAFGGLAGGSGGAIPSPVEEVPGDTPPVQDPYQSVEDRYVTRHTDGSITVKDPVTGEERLYLPDGQGGYDNPLGGGYQSEQAMLDHLAMLDRNSELLSQDAATAAKNQAEQHAQFEEQAKRESAEATEYKEWKANEERKEAQIIKLADKYGVEANEEAVRRAIKTDQIKAGIESAKQQAIAADKNVTVVGLESTKNVAATSLVLIPLALSGVGTVSVGTMAKAKLVQSGFSMAKEITDKVGDAYVEGKSLGKAAAHGVVSGTIEVAKNYAGDIGGKAAKLVPKAGEIGQKILNLTTEAAVVVGGDGVKEGLDEYNKSGDLQKALDASIKGMQKSAKTHAINKVAEVGIDKSKEFIKSRTSAVQRTRVMADNAAKKVTAGQQAVTRTQKQVTEAQRRVTFTQQNATRTRQQVTAAQGKVNTANEQLRTANGKVAAAEQKLGQARTPAEASRAQAELETAQQGAAQAQQNVNQARTELQTAQRVDTATQRVAQQAEQNLQKAQWGAQKAQSDLQTATAQRDQAMRDAWDAEQQAEVNEKLMSQVGGSDIMGGYRAVEEHLKNEGYLPKDDK